MSQLSKVNCRWSSPIYINQKLILYSERYLRFCQEYIKLRKFIQSISLPTSNVFLLFNVKQVYKYFLTWQMTDKVYPTTTQVSTQIHIGIGGSSSNRTLVGIIIIILENVYNFPTLSYYIEYVYVALRLINDNFRCRKKPHFT